MLNSHNEATKELCEKPLSCSIDGWTPKKKRHYVCFIASYKTDEGNIKETILGFRPMLDERSIPGPSITAEPRLCSPSRLVFGQMSKASLEIMLLETPKS